jgi:hypothetical protein
MLAVTCWDQVPPGDAQEQVAERLEQINLPVGLVSFGPQRTDVRGDATPTVVYGGHV